jgi:hypothetical protein
MLIGNFASSKCPTCLLQTKPRRQKGYGCTKGILNWRKKDEALKK